MKRTYIKPTTDVVSIEMQSILAASVNGVTFNSDDSKGSSFLHDGNDDYAEGDAW